jgi:hypothetical protein
MFIILIFKQTFDKMPSTQKIAQIKARKANIAYIHNNGNAAQRDALLKNGELNLSEKESDARKTRFKLRIKRSIAQKQQNATAAAKVEV